MGRYRVGWIISILLALGVSGGSARASETPVYFVTEGTAHMRATCAFWKSKQMPKLVGELVSSSCQSVVKGFARWVCAFSTSLVLCSVLL
jgi:hypothetical protein